MRYASFDGEMTEHAAVQVDKGHVPSALADLVPEYLPAVPAPLLPGVTFQYQVGKAEAIEGTLLNNRPVTLKAKDGQGLLSLERPGFVPIYYLVPRAEKKGS